MKKMRGLGRVLDGIQARFGTPIGGYRALKRMDPKVTQAREIERFQIEDVRAQERWHEAILGDLLDPESVRGVDKERR